MGFLPLFVRWLNEPCVTMPHDPGMFAGCYPLIVRSDQAELLAQSPGIRASALRGA